STGRTVGRGSAGAGSWLCPRALPRDPPADPLPADSVALLDSLSVGAEHPGAYGPSLRHARPPQLTARHSPSRGLRPGGDGFQLRPLPVGKGDAARPHELPRWTSSRSTTTASMVSSLAPRSSTSIALPPTILSRDSHSASSEEATLLISSRPCAASRSIWRRRSMAVRASGSRLMPHPPSEPPPAPPW